MEGQTSCFHTIASSSTKKGMLTIGPQTLHILSCTETVWRPNEFRTYLAYTLVYCISVLLN